MKMHADMTGGSSGGPYSGGPARSAGSTLRFFKTHHLKCRYISMNLSLNV